MCQDEAVTLEDEVPTRIEVASQPLKAKRVKPLKSASPVQVYEVNELDKWNSMSDGEKDALVRIFQLAS